ncbi:major facilitator superfamily domain-containing protein [Cladochytrium replicatum]|nr:major facilitator superfamily domain-containing protein [Cladochytrium replicatum]
MAAESPSLLSAHEDNTRANHSTVKLNFTVEDDTNIPLVCEALGDESGKYKVNNEEHARLEPPPDGGYGWVVVFSSFVTHVIVLGIQYSWGVYQSHFLLQNTFNGISQPVLSFVGTLATGTLYLFGMISGRLAERFGFRTMLSIGSLLIVGSLVLASFATELWHLLLTQGFMFGLGSSFAFFPAVSLPSQWFEKRRSVATGMAMSGSGIGGFVFSIVVGKLLVSVDFRWTLRIIALIVLVSMTVVIILVRVRIPPKRRGGTDWTVFKEPRFILLLVMGLFANFGFFIPFIFLPSYGVKQLGLSLEQGSFILSITNLGSAAGRIVLGMGADQYFGKINMLTICMLTSAICVLAWWPFTDSFGNLLSFGFVSAFFSGGFISMMPVVIAGLFGVERLPSLMGTQYTTSAVGTFAGSPVAGAIIEAKGWVPAMIYAGCLTLISVMLLLAVRFMETKKIFARI